MGKPLIEDCLALDLAWLMRLGPISTGQAGSGKINWSMDGEKIGALGFRLDLRNKDAARLNLAYDAIGGDGKRQPVRQILQLTPVQQNFGGLRWWLRCPVTGKRVRTVYLAPGDALFAGRKALGLSYRVERLTRFNRPFEKLYRMQRRLGSTQGLGTGLKRPKGMWRRTFARHLAALESHDSACIERITAAVQSA